MDSLAIRDTDAQLISKHYAIWAHRPSIAGAFNPCSTRPVNRRDRTVAFCFLWGKCVEDPAGIWQGWRETCGALPATERLQARRAQLPMPGRGDRSHRARSQGHCLCRSKESLRPPVWQSAGSCGEPETEKDDSGSAILLE